MKLMFDDVTIIESNKEMNSVTNFENKQTFRFCISEHFQVSEYWIFLRNCKRQYIWMTSVQMNNDGDLSV